MAEYVLADSGVVSRLTTVSEHSAAYSRWIGDRRIAINFQTEVELCGCSFGEERMRRLADLIDSLLKLPQTEATKFWYTRVAERRRELQKIVHPGGNAGDGDVWIVSSALEHGLTFFSHDGPAVRLGREVGLRVFTNLPQLRDENPHNG